MKYQWKNTANGLIGVTLALTVMGGCALNTQKGAGVLKKEDMDLTVKPGEDFFEYANGTWMKNTPIPADRSSYGAFTMLAEKSTKDVHNLLEEAAKSKDAKPGSNLQKIRDFYGTGMDTAKINQLGITPLNGEFARIEAISSKEDLLKQIVHMHKYGMDVLFGIGVMQDLKETEIQRLYMSEAGISLPDRDYYTSDDETSKNIRAEYVKHVTKMFELMGDEAAVAKSNAERIMKLETRMAHFFNTRLENRNMPAMYNPHKVVELTKEYPNFDWTSYLKGVGAEIKDFVIVTQPKYFAELNKIFAEEKLEDLKLYLRWHLLDSSASFLSSDFDQQNFKFFSGVLSGVDEMQPRWKRLSGVTGGVLGEVVGQLYVEKHFPAEAKERMLTLVNNLKKALRVRIQNLDWMTDATRKDALAKLDAFGVKIGYPDKWEDYSKLEVKTDSYIQNILRAREFGFNKNMAELYQPVDKEKWGMTPQTVNAYYHPLLNEVVFPAAILQPPFFYLDGDDAVNYGAIGVVIGHEMTHGFDDSGRRFDKDGNMRDWWTAEDAKQFDERTQKLVKQFDAFEAIDGMHVNGKLTLGENIADFGGLTVGLEAYKMAMAGQEAPKPIDGFTDMQRFFLSYSKVWRGNIRDKALKRNLKEDVHSPGRYRVNGGLFNIPEFYEAFEIDEKDPLYRTKEQRPTIW
jgi:putative endopeptidase